jgi:DNA-directed RNA polymerase specialized sigma24 family protein
VRQIAANEAKTLIRSRERRRAYENEAATGAVSATGAVAANKTAAFVARMSSQLATEADVRRCMEQLPPELLQPLSLRMDGYSYRDIALKLDIPEGTAKTRVRHARQALALALTETDRPSS